MKFINSIEIIYGSSGLKTRMRVHVFGNSSVAAYGIRKAVCDLNTCICDEVCYFVKNDFYVDDGLVSNFDENELVKTKQTQNV